MNKWFLVTVEWQHSLRTDWKSAKCEVRSEHFSAINAIYWNHIEWPCCYMTIPIKHSAAHQHRKKNLNISNVKCFYFCFYFLRMNFWNVKKIRIIENLKKKKIGVKTDDDQIYDVFMSNVNSWRWHCVCCVAIVSSMVAALRWRVKNSLRLSISLGHSNYFAVVAFDSFTLFF